MSMNLSNRFGKVGVLCGGLSPERSISLQSGKAVYQGLVDAEINAVLIDIGAQATEQLNAAQLDRAFLILHGPGGEDGKIQSLLETLHIPYTGTGADSSAITMDKYKSKLLWRDLGLATADFERLNADTDWVGVLDRLGGKVMVKPAREGSSLGMGSAVSADQLRHAYAVAVAHDSTVIAERWLSGREFTVALVGGQPLPAIELKTEQEFYTYDAKYLSDETQYLCPAPIDNATLKEMNRLSLAAFESLGCRGWGRVDLMMDETGALMLLEVNTAPGMTSHSLVPMSARQAGMDFSELVVKILELSMLEDGQ